jgi:hypothetical protein
VSRMGRKISAYRVLVGKTERNRLLGPCRRRWEGSFKMGGGGGVGRNRVADKRHKLRVLQNSGNAPI